MTSSDSNQLPTEVISQIKSIVHKLVTKNYTDLIADGCAREISAHDLELRFSDYYPCTLIDLPEEAFQMADVYKDSQSGYPWMVNIPLWTTEAGASDLTLSIVIEATPTGFFSRINDIRVM